MSGRYCFGVNKECAFMLKLLDQLDKLIFAFRPGKFIDTLTANLVFNDTATQDTVITLDLEGIMRYVYVKAFQEIFPANPEGVEIERINAIYDALGHPEKKIPVT